MVTERCLMRSVVPVVPRRSEGKIMHDRDLVNTFNTFYLF